VQILAATDFSTRSHRALRRAGLLAKANAAELALVHVVDDDHPKNLIEVERREAERILTEQISAIAELDDAKCRPLVVTGDSFDGILRAAASIKADLIVMGAHRKQLLRDIFVGTTIERVIRMGQYPVLMVNHEVTRPYENAIAAVDMSEPSANAIRAAKTAGLIGNEGITIVHAFFPLGKGKMYVAGIDRAAIDDYVANERQRATDELVAFLLANQLSGPRLSLRVEEGAPFEVISRGVEEMKPDFLVIGTHGRSGLPKVLLGSVTEEALRTLDIDILAVPPVKSPPDAGKF
jgi:nucleotide-binding universal stress UspA family protein